MAKKQIDTLLKETKLDQVAKTTLVACAADTPVARAIELMQQQKSGYIVVTDQKKVVGLLTEVEVVRNVLTPNVDWNRPIREFMLQNPIVLTQNDTVASAIALMGENRIYHIPLVNEKRELVEVLSVRALIRLLAEYYPAEVLNLPPKPNQIMETVEGG